MRYGNSCPGNTGQIVPFFYAGNGENTQNGARQAAFDTLVEEFNAAVGKEESTIINKRRYKKDDERGSIVIWTFIS